LSRAAAAGLLTLGAAALVGAGSRAVFGSRSQSFGDFPYRADTTDKVVALTFDDGPNEPYTSLLLDTLADRAVPATFFQVGRCAERFPDTTRRVLDNGHVLANHSLDHSFGSYFSEPSQRHQIDAAQEVLHRTSGPPSIRCTDRTSPDRGRSSWSTTAAATTPPHSRALTVRAFSSNAGQGSAPPENWAPRTPAGRSWCPPTPTRSIRGTG